MRSGASRSTPMSPMLSFPRQRRFPPDHRVDLRSTAAGDVVKERDMTITADLLIRGGKIVSPDTVIDACLAN